MTSIYEFLARKTMITENPNISQTTTIRNAVQFYEHDIMSGNFVTPNRKHIEEKSFFIEIYIALDIFNFIFALKQYFDFNNYNNLIFYFSSGYDYECYDYSRNFGKVKQKIKTRRKNSICHDFKGLRNGHKRGKFKSWNNIYKMVSAFPFFPQYFLVYSSCFLVLYVRK